MGFRLRQIHVYSAYNVGQMVSIVLYTIMYMYNMLKKEF